MDEALAVLSASLVRVPVAATQRAEFLGTALALNGLGGVGSGGIVADVTQGSAILARAPRTACVQSDL